MPAIKHLGDDYGLKRQKKKQLDLDYIGQSKVEINFELKKRTKQQRYTLVGLGLRRKTWLWTIGFGGKQSELEDWIIRVLRKM